MSLNPELVVCTDTLGYLAHNPTIAPEQRLSRLRMVANLTADTLAEAGDPTTRGEYLQSLRLKTWLACMPSLEATAAGIPHSADVAEEVLENLTPTLREALSDNTQSAYGLGGGDGVYGQIAEMAVLGTLLWSHSTVSNRVRRTVLPATNAQDNGVRRDGVATSFDAVVDDGRRVTPIQVKSTDKNAMSKQMRGRRAHSYQSDIAIVYVSRLVDKEIDSLYSPYILAEAVVKQDDEVLTQATAGIDLAIEKARSTITHPSALYIDR